MKIKICKICNKEFKNLGNHVLVKHNMNIFEYCEKMYPEILNKICACGCGEKIDNKLIIKNFWHRNREIHYLIGHRIKLRNYIVISEKQKGKTYEEIYGEEEAKKMKEHLSIIQKGTIKIKREKRICQCGCGQSFECLPKEKDRFIIGHHLHGKKPWNSGLTKETDDRVKKNTANMCIYAKKQWENLSTEEKKDKIKKMLNFSPIKQNKIEKEFENFLNNNFPNEWLYNGDGKAGFIIYGKIPDYININGKKAIIELFGDYWHKNTIEKDKKRKALFESVGYKSLFVWASEFKKSQEIIKNKIIKEFY